MLYIYLLVTSMAYLRIKPFHPLKSRCVTGHPLLPVFVVRPLRRVAKSTSSACISGLKELMVNMKTLGKLTF